MKVCGSLGCGILRDTNNLVKAEGNGDVLLALSSVHPVQLSLWSGLLAPFPLQITSFCSAFISAAPSSFSPPPLLLFLAGTCFPVLNNG